MFQIFRLDQHGLLEQQSTNLVSETERCLKIERGQNILRMRGDRNPPHI
jgi:hypothetical protein